MCVDEWGYRDLKLNGSDQGKININRYTELINGISNFEAFSLRVFCISKDDATPSECKNLLLMCSNL